MWPALLHRPDDFHDGPPAAAWFARLADALLSRTTLRAGGVSHRPIEVEVYYHGPGHEDPFAHRDPVQLHAGRWYFHRSRGAYRGGNYKGVDLAFGGMVGGHPAYAGVLLRGLVAEDGTRIDGPSLLVDHLLRLSGFARVADLDRAVGNRPAWDAGQPLVLAEAPADGRDVLRTARVGLSLKARRYVSGDPALSFLVRPYRYLSDPELTRKGKPHMVSALHAVGVPALEIAARTGCPATTVGRYIAAFDAGTREADPAPYHGRTLGPAEWCRLSGLLRGRNPADVG